MQKYMFLLIPLIFAVILSGGIITSDAVSAASNHQTNSTDLVTTTTQNIENTINAIITGIVLTCTSGDPFSGVTVAIYSITGQLLGTTTTDANGHYELVVPTTGNSDNTFVVAASYPGHMTKTQQVTVAPNLSNSSDPNLYGNANFTLGSLILTLGSWEHIGIDSNKPETVGPNATQVQIHIYNNNSTTATNVWSFFNITGNNTNPNRIMLAAGETALKYIGDIGPYQTVDVYYLVWGPRDKASYGQGQNPAEYINYTVSVWNSTTNNNSINHNLTMTELIEQNRNDISSIVSSDPSPAIGQIFNVIINSTTSSRQFDQIYLPTLLYNASVVKPLNMTLFVTLANGTVLTNTSTQYVAPGANQFSEIWYFQAIGEGVTSINAYYEDETNINNHHYSKDWNSTNATTNITSTYQTDVYSNKTVSNFNRPGDTIEFGDLITYIVKISNQGPNNASNIVYTDLLPAGLIYVNHTISTDFGVTWTPNSTAYNSTNGNWAIGTVVGNTTNQLIMNITARVNTTGNITNWANKTAQRAADNETNFTNDNSSVTFYVPKADVASTKTVTNLVNPGQTIQFGDLIYYIIKISNYGPDNASNVNYTDLLPTGLIYVNHSVSTNGGSSWVANSTAYNSITGVWNIGNITAGSINQTILNITVRVNGTGAIVNWANKTAMKEFDTNTSNDNSSVTIRVPRADVYSDKTVSNLDHPNAANMLNDLILYNVTISNAGPNDVTGVIYKDLLPAGLIYINHTISTDWGSSWVANSTAYNNTTGTWVIGNITANTVKQFILQITARINTTGYITNDINKTAMNEFDTNVDNDNDTVTIYVPKADVASTKTVDNLNRPGNTIQFNDLILYTIKISNYGADPATGVVYKDLLPEGLIYVNHTISTNYGETWTPNSTSYNPTNGTWNIGTIDYASIDQFILQITARVNKTNTTFTNWANKTDMTVYDSNLTNDNSTVVFNVSNATNITTNITFGPSACLTPPWPPINGQTILTFITAFNNGPDNATGVQIKITDIIPNSLLLKGYSLSTDGGLTWNASYKGKIPADTYNDTTGIWNVGNLTAGGPAKILCISNKINATSGTTINRTAGVVAGDQYNLNTTNGTMSVTVA